MVYSRRILAVVITVTAVCCWSTSKALIAAAPNVIYTASGTFASPPLSGNDLLQLAGQPFSISVMANAASVPNNHGSNWAVYGGLTMQGTVESGLLPGLPQTIQNRSTSISLATGNPNFDLFALGTPINVVGIALSVQGKVTMPKGTIANALIHPFTAPVTLDSSNSMLTYSNGTATTALAMIGTLTARLAGTAAPTGAAALQAGGAQVITVHADGTQSVRPVRSGPVDLGQPSDMVTLQFYASGVSGTSDVHVQIAGQNAPVLYAGPASQFEGLDQVSVQVPRILAGRGEADVLLMFA